MFSICLEAASIVLFRFAVSQLTRRLTEFLISRTIRTSSNRSIELVAPINVKKSAIFLLLLNKKYSHCAVQAFEHVDRNNLTYRKCLGYAVHK